MSYEKKKKLSHDINGLPGDSLGEVVKIIRERMPNLCSNEEEIEIDIDVLDTPTLRHLEKHIRSVQRKKGSRKKGAVATAANKLAQAEETERGTEQQIAEVERRLKELADRATAITQRGMARSAGLPVDDNKSKLDQATSEKQIENKEKGVTETDSDSGSESETSGSESSGSDDSDSESDSGSDKEGAHKRSKKQNQMEWRHWRSFLKMLLRILRAYLFLSRGTQANLSRNRTWPMQQARFYRLSPLLRKRRSRFRTSTLGVPLQQ